MKYLAPASDHHGHWVQKGTEPPRITKMIMKRAEKPPDEGGWIAVEKEMEDPLVIRRRLRGKGEAMSLKVDEQEERLEEKESRRKAKVFQVIEEEMKKLISDQTGLASEEMKIIAEIKKSCEVPLEEEEILQTKIISNKEVEENWERWLPSIMSEVKSLLEDKEALREVSSEEFEKMKKEVDKGGRKFEVIPSKMVFVKKPGGEGAPPKYKSRWVVCGNLEPVKDDELTFSSGADAAALRVMVWFSSCCQWSGSILDVRTAFLNAKIHQEDDEPILLVQPAGVFFKKKLMKPGTLFKPEKAIYGFRRSPRLWGLTRDGTLLTFRINHFWNGRTLILKLVPLASEPNLWVLQNEDEDETDCPIFGLLMTYVDDIFMASTPELLQKMEEKIKEVWTVSNPEKISEKPIRFLGVEISKKMEDDSGRECWMITQQNYIRDVTAGVKEKKIPITKDQSQMEPKEGLLTAEEVKRSQKYVGEMLWLMTRSRPDICFSVARMGANVLKSPEAIEQAYNQLRGCLLKTQSEGLCFRNRSLY